MDETQPAAAQQAPAAGPPTQDLDRPREAPLHTRALAVIRSMPRILWRTVVKSWDDSIIGHSAQAAFWQTLSLPRCSWACSASPVTSRTGSGRTPLA